ALDDVLDLVGPRVHVLGHVTGLDADRRVAGGDEAPGIHLGVGRGRRAHGASVWLGSVGPRTLSGAPRCYFAAAGNAGSLPMSRTSCWMTTVAFRLATSCFMRSMEATVAARSKLKLGTPPVSSFSRKWTRSPVSSTGPMSFSL